MVNYQDFLKSAEQLLQTGDEMGYRNAVSRAYYALYHRCLPLFNEISDHPADDHHAQVVRTLRQQPKLKSIVNRLNNLRKRRNTADYELHKTLSYYDAVSAVKMAQKAIQELDKLPQDFESD
jgi:uncharacterized protein (UPF0332 family)